jgi:RNA polymerase sigma-70 factor (ECF subfamily)
MVTTILFIRFVIPSEVPGLYTSSMTLSALAHSAPALETVTPLTPSQAEGLRALVDRHFAFVWRCLSRAGVPEGDNDDVIQRVFLTASRKLDEIRPGAERAFLYAVASREAGHLRRTHRRRGEVGQEALLDRSTGALRPDELVGRRQALAQVSSVIEQMDDELRAVFLLCEVEELSSSEAAEALDIPVGTVKSRLRRAREAFATKTRNLRAGEATS